MTYTESATRWLIPLSLAGVLLALALSAPARAGATGNEDERRETRKLYVYRGSGNNPMVIRGLAASRTYLGVQLLNLTPELMEHFGAAGEVGVMISQVAEESPAERAGLKVGDILTAVDGEPMRSAGRLAREIASREPEEAVTLEIWRQGRLETLTATLEARKRPQLDVRRFLYRHGQDDGEGFRFFTPDGEFEGLIHLDTETVEEALENLHEQLDRDHVKSRMHFFQQNGARLLERLEELEERLQKLERELEELPRGNP